MKKSKHSAAYIRRTIDAAWHPFRRVAEKHASRYFTEAFEAERKTEREHRAFGTRFTRGAAGYRLPIDYAAKLMLLQHTFEQTPVPTTWEDFVGYAERVALCHAMRESIVRADAYDAAFPEAETFMRLDYAEDIAA